jgi:hypothetical protein
MSQLRYVIEIDGKPAGVVVAERSGFRFFSAASAFFPLERRIFRSAGHAEEACRELQATAVLTAS